MFFLLRSGQLSLGGEGAPSSLALPKTIFDYKIATRWPIRITVWGSILLHALFAIWYYTQRVEPARLVLPGNINIVLEAAPMQATRKPVKVQARPVAKKTNPAKKTKPIRQQTPKPVLRRKPRKHTVVKQSTKVVPVSLPVTPPAPQVATQAEASPVYLPPKVVNEIDNPKPHYPAAARRRGMQGTVWLLVRVSENGKVGAVTVRQSSGFRLLDNAAADAVKRWQFAPGRQGMLAKAGEVIVPVKFNLVSGTL